MSEVHPPTQGFYGGSVRNAVEAKRHVNEQLASRPPQAIEKVRKPIPLHLPLTLTVEKESIGPMALEQHVYPSHSPDAFRIASNEAWYKSKQERKVTF